MRKTAWALGWLLTGLLLVGGCAAEDAGDGSGAAGPVLVVGIDGFEWDVAFPLLEGGRMPTLAGLMASGIYGELSTTSPTFSPIIWTSIATGKPPERHGIRGFVHGGHRASADDRRLYTSYDRRTKAFWNVVSDYDKRVAVIGWWMTYPVEEINGVMVAQVNTLEQAQGEGRVMKGGMLEGLEGQVQPPERLDEFLEIHRQVAGSLGARVRRIFGSFDGPLQAFENRQWKNSLWSFRSDATYVEIASRLAREEFDLLAVYLGGPDVVGHRYWRYLHPEEFEHQPAARELELFGSVIEDYYAYVDQAIGLVLAAMPRTTSVLVVSDHGMHAINQSWEFDPRVGSGDRASGHHGDAPSGVLIASGPAFGRPQDGPTGPLERSALRPLGSVFDVTPTLLAALGVPVGEDMEGRVLAALLPDDLVVATVPSHDDREWRQARMRLDGDRLSRARDPERIEQLRALGYVN